MLLVPKMLIQVDGKDQGVPTEGQICLYQMIFCFLLINGISTTRRTLSNLFSTQLMLKALPWWLVEMEVLSALRSIKSSCRLALQMASRNSSSGKMVSYLLLPLPIPSGNTKLLAVSSSQQVTTLVGLPVMPILASSIMNPTVDLPLRASPTRSLKTPRRSRAIKSFNFQL